MATTKGKDGRFYIGSNKVAEVRSFSFNLKAEVADDSTIEDTWDTGKVTTMSGTGSADVWWDPTDTTGQMALEAGEEGTANLYPAGTGSGATYYTGAIIVTDVGIANKRDGIVEQSISFRFNGAASRTTVGA